MCMSVPAWCREGIQNGYGQCHSSNQLYYTLGLQHHFIAIILYLCRSRVYKPVLYNYLLSCKYVCVCILPERQNRKLVCRNAPSYSRDHPIHSIVMKIKLYKYIISRVSLTDCAALGKSWKTQISQWQSTEVSKTENVSFFLYILPVFCKIDLASSAFLQILLYSITKILTKASNALPALCSLRRTTDLTLYNRLQRKILSFPMCVQKANETAQKCDS